MPEKSDTFIVAESPNYTITPNADKTAYHIVNNVTGVLEIVEPILPRALNYLSQLEEELLDSVEEEVAH